jgi:hypothetical protein
VKQTTIQQALLSSGSMNKHVSIATSVLQQRKDLFFAVCAQMLKEVSVSRGQL